MAVLATENGPQKDPFDPLRDEFTDQLDRTIASSFFERFDPERVLLKPLDKDGTQFLAFSPERLGPSRLRSELIALKTQEERPLKGFLRLVETFDSYVSLLENFPSVCQQAVECGVDRIFMPSIPLQATGFLSKICYKDSDTAAAKLVLLELKYLDMQRLLLDRDQSIPEIEENLNFLKEEVKGINFFLGRLQDEGAISAEDYKTIERVREDIPIWESRFGPAVAFNAAVDSENASIRTMNLLEGLSALFGGMKASTPSAAEVEKRVQEERECARIVDELVLQSVWEDPLGELRQRSATKSLVVLTVNSSDLSDESMEREVLNAVSASKDDRIVLEVSDLVRNLLEVKRMEGSPIDVSKAYQAICEYIELLQENPSLAALHVHLGLPTNKKWRLDGFVGFERAIDVLRGTGKEIIVLAPETEFSGGGQSKQLSNQSEVFTHLSGDRRNILINLSVGLPTSRFDFHGSEDDIFQVAVRSLRGDLHFDRLATAMYEKAKWAEKVGVARDDLMSIAGENRRRGREFSLSVGHFGYRIPLSNGEVSGELLYGADLYVFYPQKYGGDNDGDGDQITSDSPYGNLLLS